MARIVLIAPYVKFYVNFRWEFLQTLALEGHEVFAIGPPNNLSIDFTAIGVKYTEVPLKNTGINPVYDMYTMFKLMLIMKELKPDIVLCMAIKPVLYGSLAASLTRVKNIYLTVTGLGYVFIGTSLKKKLLMLITSILYRKAINLSKKVLFENADDLQLFKKMKLLKDPQKACIINGSGVNLEKFSYCQEEKNPISFILIARLIRDKGIIEFVEASRILKNKYPWVKCSILGPFDENPSSISKEEVKAWVNQGVIEYLGETTDVRAFLLEASVLVLPSYREGTPKSVLEGMAMGLPIITTDAPGCRQTVKHQENGFLVPIKDYKLLAYYMEKLLLNPSLVHSMGKRSREIAINKYDVRKVNESIKKHIGLD